MKNLSLNSNLRPAGVYWRPNPEFISEIANWLQDRPVLEIFAGNGYLAAHLAALGCTVQATSILSGMDAHAKGLFYPVEPMEAVSAVRQYGLKSEVLLACWPTVTERMLEAVRAWGGDKDILYIGEVTDYAKGYLGGCATDLFFNETVVTHEFRSYKGNMLEHAQIRRLRV